MQAALHYLSRPSSQTLGGLSCRAIVTGAITAEPPQPLPADMQAFVQSAGEAGVVFASLGCSGLAGERWPRLRPGRSAVAQARAADPDCKALQLLLMCTAWLHPWALSQMQHNNVLGFAHLFRSRPLLRGHPHLRFSDLSAAEVHELEAIRDALAAIAPTKAIWKLHPTDLISLKERNVSLNIPANVMVTPFAPQNSLLGHPKLRAFLTQAGTNSFLEASLLRLLGCAHHCSVSQPHVASGFACLLLAACLL